MGAVSGALVSSLARLAPSANGLRAAATVAALVGRAEGSLASKESTSLCRAAGTSGRTLRSVGAATLAWAFSFCIGVTYLLDAKGGSPASKWYSVQPRL